MKKIFLVLMLVLIAGQAWCADEWLVTRPALTGDQWTAWPAASQANNKSLDRLLANYREGMTLTYSSASAIVVTAGEIVCSNSDGSVRKMRKNPSNTNVTFSDIDTGSEASSTTYYIYAVADADAETATFKISASSTAPTGVTYYKRLGSFYNNSSSDISYILNDNIKRFTNAESKTVGSTYVASSDGIVYAEAYADTTGNNCCVIAVYSDYSSTPTSVIGQSGGCYIPSVSCSVTVPVTAGNYYKASVGSGATAGSMKFTPLN